MKKNISIPIMFCFDTNYVIPAAAAFYSLLENSSKEYNYIFYVLHSDITESQQKKLNETIKEFKNCKLEFINMEHRLDDFWSENYKGGHFSKEVMYKLLVASIFPKLDKIIVSDVDVIFLGDISQSYFELNDEDNAYIAGVKPIGKISSYLDTYKKNWTDEEIKKLGNICGGYLVMNLKKIREDNFEQIFLDSLKENGHRLNQMEQDIFNITCYGHMKHLHLKYVACSYMWDYYKTDEDKKTDINYSKREIEEAMNETVQLHYATSTKPWKNVDCTLSNIWFKYIVKTPFAQEYLNELPNKIVVPESRINYIVNNESIREKLRKITVLRKLINLLRRIKSKIKNIFIKIKKKIINTKKKIKNDNFSLLIIDDIFPSTLSPFRYEEYINYCSEFSNVIIATTGNSISLLNENLTCEELINKFKKKNPKFYGEIFDISTGYNKEFLDCINSQNKVISIMTFKHNVLSENNNNNLKFLEENNIPFIFTLYPGGGFIINDEKCNEDLKKIFSSPCFKKVIVTQEITKNYLIEQNLCDEDKIEFIFGVVTPKKMFRKTNAKNKQKNNKFNVVFVAHKYSKQGKDKGYDLFIQAAKKLHKKNKNIEFNVVGGFDENDYNVEDLKSCIKFHGILSSIELRKLYKHMNVIVSPTRPFVLSSGSFDGFPTGASTEAMLNKVVLITTDELNLNNKRFIKDKDLIIIKPNYHEIAYNIEKLYNNSKLLKKIANNGYKKVRKLYNYKSQMVPRIKLIRKISKDIR